MQGDKVQLLSKVLNVMDVVFGERTGRMRRVDSLQKLRESLREAHLSLSVHGDLLHAESLLRHLSEQSSQDTAASSKSGPLLSNSPGTLLWASSAASSTDGVTLAHEQLVELKRSEVSAWFKGAPFAELRRGDLEDLMACSFYTRTIEEVRELGHGDELDSLVDTMSEATEFKFPPGTSKYSPMKVGMDPIAWIHRPFVFYAFTDLSLKAITFVAMRSMGFHHYSSGTLRYWYRHGEGEGSARVFCHGVGLGVTPYMDLLRRLSHTPGPLFAIELEAIAMRIQRTVPSHNEVAANIRDMLWAWGLPSAHFIGHSFGTAVMAWVLKLHPELVSRASYLDPLVFLLCNPMMCFKFMYKVPRKAAEKLMHFFVSSELYMANMLSRHFIWHEVLLWEEDLSLPEGSLILLSGADALVPSHEVRRYMNQKAPSCTEVLWIDNAFHGEFLLRPKVLNDLVDKLK
jgi:pimeloyl-ACP methyl ester carboxylesterase